MHVGAVCIFEGPPPGYEELLEHISSRLHLVPRFRQKLAFPPVQTGRPFWVDDPTFNLEYHVRHSALPAPGSEEQLKRMASRIFSQQLDRTKPLWELWLVQGLTRKRFAFVTKTHHALVDGVSGVDIATVLFDLQPVPEPAEPDHEWTPDPEPSAATLIGEGSRGPGRGAGSPRATGRGGARRTPSAPPARSRRRPRASARSGGRSRTRRPTCRSTSTIGSHRRYTWVRGDLAHYKRIKDALGGTVNDVVLAVVAGSLREWLQERGIRTEGLELRALVPVSIRAEDERGHLGNRIAVMRGPLPVYVEDPVARLHAVTEAMRGLKSSKQALGAEVISRFNDFAPPTLLAQASRLNFSTRLFNLIVTNVPGPQIPLYVLGRELQDIFPVAFLPQDHALAIAIMSYNGGINFGLLADYDSMDDVDVIADGLERALAELAEAAAAERAREEPAPA